MSLRLRITALATVAVLAVLLVAGFVILAAHERALVSTLDERLEQERAVFLTEADLTAPADDDSVAQLVRDGRVVAVRPAAFTERDPDLGSTPLAEGPAAGEDLTIRTVAEVLPDEGTYRVLSADLGGGDVLHLAANLDDVHDSASALRRSFALSVPVVLVVLGALIWWFVGRTLQPVEAIRRQVSAIGGRDLHRRVPVPAADDEVGRLARTMNDMLERLEASAEQQRRFVADASHELRSPLTRMRAELEVDLARPEDADLLATHRSALEEVVALQHMVEDLLDLARHPGHVTAARREAVDLDDLVLHAARRARADGPAQIDTTQVGPAQVQGDASQLRRLIGNLLDNAVRHAASAVYVGLQEIDGHAELVVADDGPGVAAQDRQRVFEAFTRLDESRTVSTGGTGLGLAIVHDIVEAHGGDVRVDERPGGGARFTVALPA